MNLEGMRSLATAYCRANLIKSNTHITNGVQNFGPYGLSLGGIFSVKTKNVTIDFDAVDNQLHNAVIYFERCNKFLQADSLSNHTIRYLFDIRASTQYLNQQTSSLLSDAAQANAAAFQSFDSRISQAMEAARFVRDCSFSFVVMGAGVLAAPEVLAIAGTTSAAWTTSGAAAAAAAGLNSSAAGIGTLLAASTLKGAATFQDGYRGSSSWTDQALIGDALITVGGTFATSLVPANPKWSKGVQGLLIISTAGISGGAAASQQLVRGNTWRQALAAGGVAVAGSVVGSGIDRVLPLGDLPLSSTVTMRLLGNLAAKTGIDEASGQITDSIVNALGRSPLDWSKSSRFACISSGGPTIELNYITDNVLRPVSWK